MILTKTFPKRYDDFVTWDCELNFDAFDEPASFQEVVNSDVWKSAMQREYDALIKMELGGWWTLQFEPNRLDASGYIKISIKKMVHLTNTKRDL